MKKNKLNISKLPTLTPDIAKHVLLIINKEHPEWGTQRFNYDPSEYKHHSWGTGSNSAVLFESNFHYWAVVKRDYFVTDLDEMSATEDNTMMLFMKDGRDFETHSVDVLPDGKLDFSSIDEPYFH